MNLSLSDLEPFDGMNYRRWSQKLLMIFEQLEIDYVVLHAPLVTNVVEPEDEIMRNDQDDDIRKYEKDNKTVRYYILSHMTDMLFDLFVVHKSAKTIWDLLEKKYGADNKLYGVEKWLAFSMVDNKPIMEQIHVFEKLSANLVNAGMKICENFLAYALLEKFPPSWKDYQNHLKQQRKNISLQELISHMRIEEAIRLKDKVDSMPTQSDIVESGGPSNTIKFKGKEKARDYQKKGSVKKKSHNKFNGPSSSIQKPRNMLCYVCEKPGHKAYQCPQRHSAS